MSGSFVILYLSPLRLKLEIFLSHLSDLLGRLKPIYFLIPVGNPDNKSHKPPKSLLFSFVFLKWRDTLITPRTREKLLAHSRNIHVKPHWISAI